MIIDDSSISIEEAIHFFFSGTSYDNWAKKPYLKSRDNAPLEVSEQPPLGPSKKIRSGKAVDQLTWLIAIILCFRFIV